MEKPYGEANRDRPPASRRAIAERDKAAPAQPEGAAAGDGAAERPSAAPIGAAQVEPPSAAPVGAAQAERLSGSSPAITIEEPPPSQREHVTKPLLASEALMEDLAPMRPAQDAARVWCAVVGVGFLLFGGLSVAGLRPDGVVAGPPAFVLGIVALFTALTSVSYRQRAIAMVVLGTIATVIGLQSSGPAVGWGAARAVAAIALPAALVFRSRYRAYAGARWLLVAAFLVALPSFGHAAAQLTLLEPHLAQLGALMVILAVLSSLTGFMGAETTGAGSSLAVAVVLAFMADLVVGRLAQLGAVTPRDLVSVLSAGLAFAATSALTSLGLFQILAWRLAADARRIDLHRPENDKEGGDRRPPSGGEWLT
ncbi:MULTISPECIES: hypothetical protein [Sorangium]|uniref:Uncharacterized protein n=1 Tax=Sorangium cellulosum TaxID=56 RepID=A0A4P2QVP2_SORCE|nr:MULTISPECIES: hypothetical protein [Sorangium]AUX33673.1 hypothetical protein SOCE836_058350 [Sorangium cellulosum]WCQ92985.1 hypothetical protein NQZ70_05731 [Sorangium sp. Soce836]